MNGFKVLAFQVGYHTGTTLSNIEMGNIKSKPILFTIKEYEVMRAKIRQYLAKSISERNSLDAEQKRPGYIQKGQIVISYYHASPKEDTPTEEQEEEFSRVLRGILPEYHLECVFVMESFPGQYVLEDKHPRQPDELY